MQNIVNEIVELIRFTSADLPEDVTAVLKKAHEDEETGSAARGAFQTILTNVDMTRRDSTPICQDTGTPLFFVSYGEGWNPISLKEQIRNAIADATKKSFLRPNAVDAINGINSGNNLGDEHFPTIHFEENNGNGLTVDLMLKGGGCENVGAQYSLPDTTLNAGRDLEGVRKVVLDAVFRAQGHGCAPGFLGIAIGGDRGSGYLVSKQALLRKLEDENPDPALVKLEEQITREANELGIGPMGFGGKATILGTKIKATHRLPASYFVTISYMCWAYRHRKMKMIENKVSYQ